MGASRIHSNTISQSCAKHVYCHGIYSWSYPTPIMIITSVITSQPIFLSWQLSCGIWKYRKHQTWEKFGIDVKHQYNYYYKFYTQTCDQSLLLVGCGLWRLCAAVDAQQQHLPAVLDWHVYDANTFLKGFDDALKLLSTLTDYQQPGCGSNDKASSSEVGHD